MRAGEAGVQPGRRARRPSGAARHNTHSRHPAPTDRRGVLCRQPVLPAVQARRRRAVLRPVARLELPLRRRAGQGAGWSRRRLSLAVSAAGSWGRGSAQGCQAARAAVFARARCRAQALASAREPPRWQCIDWLAACLTARRRCGTCSSSGGRGESNVGQSRVCGTAEAAPARVRGKTPEVAPGLPPPPHAPRPHPTFPPRPLMQGRLHGSLLSLHQRLDAGGLRGHHHRLQEQGPAGGGWAGRRAGAPQGPSAGGTGGRRDGPQGGDRSGSSATPLLQQGMLAGWRAGWRAYATSSHTHAPAPARPAAVPAHGRIRAGRHAGAGWPECAVWRCLRLAAPRVRRVLLHAALRTRLTFEPGSQLS